MAKKTQTPMRASRKDERVMPETNEQGWGSLTGAKTQVVETESNGVRTITRTGV